MKNLKKLALIFVGITVFVSCSKDDNPVPTPVNEEEVITTVTTTLTNGSNVITLKSRDLDGDGPNNPLITASGNLVANTTYTGTVTFLNEIANPTDNITEEVLAEGVDHQLFYQPSPASIGVFTYADTDVNGKPIGLQFSLTTGAAISGNLLVTLRHEPNKSAVGVSSGNITNAGGATDAAVIYPVVIQ